MKHLLRTLCLLICLTAPNLAVASPESAIAWVTFEEAQRLEGQSAPRKFFLYFYTQWCGYCRKLEQKTFMDRAVADYINTHFTPVRIDSEKMPKIAARYRIGGVPDIRFVTGEGEEIARWPGYIEPGQLLPLLKYIHSDSYLKMGFNEFLKQK
jgi:thioredoxin-related protein